MDSSILNKVWFKTLFDNIVDKNDMVQYTSYTYVISKTFDNQEYFKVGYGKRGDGRLHDPATYLAPPFSDKGFKIHLIMFFPQVPSGNKEYAHMIEGDLHKALEIKYKRVPHIQSGIDSEWFLVPNSITFFKIIKTTISQVRPKPIAIYEFKKSNKTATKIKIKQNQKHTRDYVELVKQAEMAKKLAKEMKPKTVGNQKLYTQKLKGVHFKQDGMTFEIQKVEYSRRDKVFYVYYSKVGKQTRLSENQYFDSISNVLYLLGEKKAAELGLETNFYYYKKINIIN
jgi:hypothetical protein